MNFEYKNKYITLDLYFYNIEKSVNYTIDLYLLI
jgi:hypothetical protein